MLRQASTSVILDVALCCLASSRSAWAGGAEASRVRARMRQFSAWDLGKVVVVGDDGVDAAEGKSKERMKARPCLPVAPITRTVLVSGVVVVDDMVMWLYKVYI